MIDLSPTARKRRRAGWSPAALGPLVLAVVVSLCAATGAAARTADRGVSRLTITGRGLGHGVGLSQWGAEERARAGQTFRQILSFYYPGARLVRTPDVQIRVLVADAPALRFGSRAPFDVADAAGGMTRLDAGSHRVDATGHVDGTELAVPFVARAGAAPLTLGGVAYAGTLTFEPGGAGLQAVNTLDLEEYLVGVVSSENPGYWAQAALRAQAVASRTYALANLSPSRSFDVYPDDRSQNYHGLQKHFASAERAVSATRGQALLYGGRPISAFFSASNGGFTSGVEGVWGGPSLPYLVSRPDRFDALSPARTWGPITIGLAKLRAAFPSLATADITSVDIRRNSSRRAVTVTFRAAGKSYTVPGSLFQDRLALPSTYLSVTPVFSR